MKTLMRSLRPDPASREAAGAPVPARRKLPDGRWHPAEFVFWLLPVAAFFALPDYLILGSQILITGLFALSLDLILGYAGMVSLGHAAFFGLGGGLGIDVLGLDPTFPLKYMVYFLLVVSVGGTGTIKGPLVAALILGVFDVAGKYFLPEIGGFVIYALMVVLLILFPAGLYGRRT